MALTASKYEALPDHLAQKRLDIDSDTLKCVLLKDTYVPNYVSQAFLSDVVAHEAVGTGYVAGGVTLTGVTWTKDDAGAWRLKATIPTWDATGGALSAAFAIFYGSTGSAATSPLICAWNLDGAGGTVTATNDKFTLTQNASGILSIS